MPTAKQGVPTTVLVANAMALATLVPISLHQLGFIDHLPDPPSTLFDSDRITGSKAAHPFGIPDGVLGLGSFGVTLALALTARRSPAARKLLAAKVLFDTAYAGVNAVRQVVSFGKLCSWCTGTALCTFLSAAAAAPLVRGELHSLSTRQELGEEATWPR